MFIEKRMGSRMKLCIEPDSEKLWRTVSTVLGKSAGKYTTPPFSPAEFLSVLESKVKTIRSATAPCLHSH